MKNFPILKPLIIGAVLALMNMEVSGQSSRAEKLDSAFYDPFLFPAVSASILPKGFVEINSFSSLLYSTRRFNNESKPFENNIKTSVFSSLAQVNYGVSASGRFNIGLDLSYLAYRLDIDTESSPFKVLGNSEAFASDQYLSHLGFRVRYLPLARKRNLLFQHAFEVSVNKQLPLQNRFNSQLIYIHSLSRKLFLFNQLDLRYAFPKGNSKASLSVPYTAVLSYLLKPNFQLFGLANFTPLFTQTDDGGLPVFVTQAGLGLQYQFSARFGANVFYNRYLYGKNIEQHTGINLGLRTVI